MILGFGPGDAGSSPARAIQEISCISMALNPSNPVPPMPPIASLLGMILLLCCFNVFISCSNLSMLCDKRLFSLIKKPR